jgi:hypothetical protein
MRVVRTPGRWRSAKPSAIKDRAMSVLIGLLVVLLFGFACVRAVRATISRRRRLVSKMLRGHFD